MTGTSHGNVFDYFNTFSAVLDWWFLSKPECQKLSYLVSRVLDLKDTATLQFTNLLFNYRSGILLYTKAVARFHQPARDFKFCVFGTCARAWQLKRTLSSGRTKIAKMVRVPNGWYAYHGLVHSWWLADQMDGPRTMVWRTHDGAYAPKIVL